MSLSQTSNEANKDTLIQLLTALVHEFKETVQCKFSQVLEKIEMYHEEQKTLHNTVHKLSTEVDKHTQELTALKEMLNTKSLISTSITNNKDYIQQQSQHTLPNSTTNTDRGIRKNNLIITGLDVGRDDPVIFIQAFLSARFNLRQDCLLAAQKLTSRSQTLQQQNTRWQGTTVAEETAAPPTAVEETAAPPRYLITLKSFWDSEIIYNRRLQVLKNEQIYISEDLSIPEARLFYKARQLKKAHKIHTTWTKWGKIYIKRDIFTEPEELKDHHPLLSSNTSTIPQPSETPTELNKDDNEFISEQGTEKIYTTNEIKTNDKNSEEKHEDDKNQEEDQDLNELIAQAITGAITRAATKKTKKEKTYKKSSQHESKNT